MITKNKLSSGISPAALLLTGTKTLSFKYDHNGMRTKKTVSGTTTEYFYSGNLLMGQYDGTKKLGYVYSADGKLLGAKYTNGTSTKYIYYMYNLQGDVIGLYDTNGEILCEYRYDAWGKCIGVYDESGAVITSASHVANVNPIRYRGYYYDSETGFYATGTRYYDPEIGRFINADSVVSGTGESVQGYNLFAYCNNNPVNMSDETGHWPSWAKKLVAAVAVVAVVAAVAAITVATAGTGTAIACIAIGAAKGAAIGFAVGAVTGAATSVISNRIKTGSWKGSGQAALEGGADGALSGAITGAITGGMNSNVCFIAGTSVLTSAGHVAIEDIRTGDRVWSENPETGEKELKEVVRTFVNETDELVHVYANGEEIVTTPEHPFYVPSKGWTGAIHLRAGDILVLQNGRYAIVEKIQHELLESPIKVYNFEVADFHTYYVGDSSILVHNVCKPTSPVKVNDNALKKIDVHAFKEEFVSKNIAHWDVFKDTANNSALWLGNKAQTVWHETGYFMKDLLEIFPK